MGLKEVKVTCMEFRPTTGVSNTDRGYLLWIGTKDGHLFEVDVGTGIVRGTKYVAHLHPVTYMAVLWLRLKGSDIFARH